MPSEVTFIVPLSDVIKQTSSVSIILAEYLLKQVFYPQQGAIGGYICITESGIGQSVSNEQPQDGGLLGGVGTVEFT